MERKHYVCPVIRVCDETCVDFLLAGSGERSSVLLWDVSDLTNNDETKDAMWGYSHEEEGTIFPTGLIQQDRAMDDWD